MAAVDVHRVHPWTNQVGFHNHVSYYNTMADMSMFFPHYSAQPVHFIEANKNEKREGKKQIKLKLSIRIVTSSLHYSFKAF